MSESRRQRAVVATIVVVLAARFWLGGWSGWAAAIGVDPLAGGRGRAQATPATDLSCADFATQADAQRALEADPSDPNGLDPNQNGVACEEDAASVATRAARSPEPAIVEATARPTEPSVAEVATAPPVAAAPARAIDDVDCADFQYQEDAQVVLDLDPSDPYNLDPSHDGVACSSLPHRGSARVVAVPRTGAGISLAPNPSPIAMGEGRTSSPLACRSGRGVGGEGTPAIC
ncbi:MAG TPA: hypothetical protein VFU81_11640 [Thermomicrobiales bacterium]|nr:hypothetical protein [Thermomicrobiales bacterium]